LLLVNLLVPSTPLTELLNCAVLVKGNVDVTVTVIPLAIKIGQLKFIVGPIPDICLIS
jgi:hypothetical protein